MKKNCSKNILLISLGILFLALASTGVYFLLEDSNEKTKTADKYGDVLNWCDTQTSGDQLVAHCKALLLNIETLEDEGSCFTSQVITNNSELKDLAICEGSAVLTYENEILEYKKLKPIDIQMQYRWGSGEKKYSLSAVYIATLSEEYIISLINEDVNSLISATFDTELSEITSEAGITKLSTTNTTTYIVKNSMDFCPTAESLEQYLADTSAYSNFYESKIQTADQYNNLLYEDTFLEIVPNLFACKSSNNLGYAVCDNSIDRELIPASLLNGTNVAWGNEMKLMDVVYLKKISILYDFLHKGGDTPTDNLETITSHINYTETVNETTICAMYTLYEAISNQEGKNILTTLVFNNLDKVTSPSCLNLLPTDMIDNQGRYIKGYLNNINNDNVLRIYNDCTNLSSLVNE